MPPPLPVANVNRRMRRVDLTEPDQDVVAGEKALVKLPRRLHLRRSVVALIVAAMAALASGCAPATPSATLAASTPVLEADFAPQAMAQCATDDDGIVDPPTAASAWTESLASAAWAFSDRIVLCHLGRTEGVWSLDSVTTHHPLRDEPEVGLSVIDCVGGWVMGAGQVQPEVRGVHVEFSDGTRADFRAIRSVVLTAWEQGDRPTQIQLVLDNERVDVTKGSPLDCGQGE